VPTDQFGDKPNSPNVLVALFPAEAESFAKVSTHYIAIQNLDTMSTALQLACEQFRQR
jgi:hypothetical protein